MKPGEHFMPNKGELLTVILDYVGVPMRVQCSFLGLMELVGGGLDALLFEDPPTIYGGCFLKRRVWIIMKERQNCKSNSKISYFCSQL